MFSTVQSCPHDQGSWDRQWDVLCTTPSIHKYMYMYIIVYKLSWLFPKYHCITLSVWMSLSVQHMHSPVYCEYQDSILKGCMSCSQDMDYNWNKHLLLYYAILCRILCWCEILLNKNQSINQCIGVGIPATCRGTIGPEWGYVETYRNLGIMMSKIDLELAAGAGL